MQPPISRRDLGRAALAWTLTATARAGTPPSATGPIAQRGVYLNIASPLPPLTVHDWDDARWTWYLDLLAAGHINRLYFYIWQDAQSDFACAPAHRARNRRLHARMRDIIPWAQRRGIKVYFLITPTFIPRVLWDRHPELHADIEYVRAGFPCICPSQSASWPLMRRFVDHEFDWFKQADGFQLWFYDPGGCMCPRCRADLTGPLLTQARVFSRLAWAKNQDAEFQISMWPIWAWEDQLKRHYGAELLDRLAGYFDSVGPPIGIVDTADDPRSFLGAAHRRGFHTHAFLFSADIETPFVFLNPQFGYLRATASRIAARGYTGAFVHSLTPGSKTLNTFIAAQALWDPTTGAAKLAFIAARRFTGNQRAATILAPALQVWEHLLRDGQPRVDQAVHVHRQVQSALACLPRSRGDELEWLATTARVLETLVRAAAALDDGSRQKALAATFRTTLAASPTFHNFAAQGSAAFPRLVQWIAKGWQAEHF